MFNNSSCWLADSSSISLAYCFLSFGPALVSVEVSVALFADKAAAVRGERERTGVGQPAQNSHGPQEFQRPDDRFVLQSLPVCYVLFKNCLGVFVCFVVLFRALFAFHALCVCVCICVSVCVSKELMLIMIQREISC